MIDIKLMAVLCMTIGLLRFAKADFVLHCSSRVRDRLVGKQI